MGKTYDLLLEDGKEQISRFPIMELIQYHDVGELMRYRFVCFIATHKN